jgi:hypothetical protein
MPGHPTCTSTATAAAAVGRRTNVNPVARTSAPGAPDRTTTDNGNLGMATRDAGADTTGWIAVSTGRYIQDKGSARATGKW